jgi:hypothetical protein
MAAARSSAPRPRSDNRGNWATTISGADLGALTALVDGTYSLKTDVVSAASSGSIAAPTATQSFRIDRLAPSFSGLSANAADGILNKADLSTGLSLSGTTTAEAGQVVALRLGDLEQQGHGASERLLAGDLQ